MLAHGIVKEREVQERENCSSSKIRTHIRTGRNDMAKQKHRATSDAVQILYRRYYEGRPERVRAFGRGPRERQRGTGSLLLYAFGRV